MRVLHITSGNMYGGVEAMLVTMARHRNEARDLEQEFAVCFEGRLLNDLKELGARVHHFPPVRLSRPLTLLRARKALKLVLSTSAFDAAICHSPWCEAVFGPVVRRCALPLVMWAHNTHRGVGWLEKLAQLTPPDLIVSNSKYTAEFSATYMPRAAQVVILCPVELRTATDLTAVRLRLRAEFATPKNASVIVLAGRMESWKGHRVLLTALNRLREQPDWYCWIVGGPQRETEKRYFQKLTSMATKLGIAHRVRFAGQRSDMASVMAAADLYCQPNESPEPFGISVVEAMSNSLPVVASSTGATPELIDADCGILVRPGDDAGLARAIAALLSDSERARTLGARGRDRARRLCLPADRLAQLHHALTAVVANSPRAAGTRAAARIVDGVRS